MKRKSKNKLNLSKNKLNNAEILFIKLYYTIISILLGEASYKDLDNYIIQIRKELDNKQINILNIINALRNVGVFKLFFFMMDINNLKQLIIDTINVLYLKTNKKELTDISRELTIRYIFLKFFSIIKTN